MFSIARLYPIGRTSLNVYAADIPNVYDSDVLCGSRGREDLLS